MATPRENRVSLHGLDPEEALRALLRVDPDANEADDSRDDDHDHEAPAI